MCEQMMSVCVWGGGGGGWGEERDDECVDGDEERLEDRVPSPLLLIPSATTASDSNSCMIEC